MSAGTSSLPFSLSETDRAALRFIVELQEIHHAMPSSTESVVGGLEDLLQKVFCDFKAKLPEYSLEKNEICQRIDQYLSKGLLQTVQSQHQVKRNLLAYCGLVEPKEEMFGVTYKADVNSQVIREKKVYAQYVPLRETLENMLNNLEIFNFVMKSADHIESDCLESVRDGTVFKENKICKIYPGALLFQLYEDDIEVVNPLGSHTKTHKLKNVYFTLYNIPEHARSNLKSIALVSVAKSKYIKEFGYDACLKDFFSVMRQLESESGLNVVVGGSQINLHGTLLCFSGDTLAMNFLGGFKEGVGFANKPCRMCLASKENLSEYFCERFFVMRNKNSHEVQVSELEKLQGTELATKSAEFGVTKRSLLMSELETFDVTKMLPMDLMHNLLEGVCDVVMKALLYHVIEESALLTYGDLNSMLETFPYPEELSRSKPSKIEKVHVVESQLRQTATQTATLLVVLPIVLAHVVHENDQKYLNFLLLCQISQILMSFKVKKSTLPALRQMIEEHHTQFKILYPDVRITPKFHFLVHAPTVLELYGATRNTWCMRFEARHAWFKQTASQSNNFKNLEKSLAHRFQMRRVLDFGLGDPTAVVLGSKLFEVVNCTKIKSADVPLGKIVAAKLECDSCELLNVVEKINIKNFSFCQGKILLLEESLYDLPKFAEITAVFIEATKCVLVVRHLETKHFVYKKLCYSVGQTNNYEVLCLEDLPTIQPFPKVVYRGEHLVNLMYYDRMEYLG